MPEKMHTIAVRAGHRKIIRKKWNVYDWYVSLANDSKWHLI